ncbi:hypothetical protein ACFL00_03235 [Pseudomonadota bacterium]
MKIFNSKTRSPRNIFIALSFFIFVFLPVLSFDFGITEDEQMHNQHGKSILAYFQGTDDKAARNPLDSEGRVSYAYDVQGNDLSGALNIYGGTFDLVCAAVIRYVSPFGEFETRHIINSLFGALLMVFTGLLAAWVAGWRAGVIALILMACSPRIIGHSMNNPKDIPFAAMYMVSLYFMLLFVERLPGTSWKIWLPLLFGMALASDIRIAGLVLFAYLGLFVLVRLAYVFMQHPGHPDNAGNPGRSVVVTVLICVAGYLLISAWWPYAHSNPLTVPVTALQKLSRLETFDAYAFFEGRWIHRWEIPWYFAPKWFLIGMPLFLPIGLMLSVFIFIKPLSRVDWKKTLPVFFTFLFPMVFIIARDSNIYNDARHLLFAVPPALAICAVSFENLLRVEKAGMLKWATLGILVVLTLEPLSWMLRNHPNEGVYFSPLIGGVNGSLNRYEADFWGNSVRQAVEWTQENSTPSDDHPIRIRIWYGDQMKAAYYINKVPGYVHVLVNEDSRDWDYYIYQAVQTKFFHEIREFWPPFYTVHEIKVGDVPLDAIVKNWRNDPYEVVLAHIDRRIEARGQNYYNLYQLALVNRYFGKLDESVEAAKRSLALNPEYSSTWKLLCGVNHARGDIDDEIESCGRAQELDPGDAIVQKNLAHALRSQAMTMPGTTGDDNFEGLPADLEFEDYLDLSFRFYQRHEYLKSMAASKLAVSKSPLNAMAYNNLCSAYNGMKLWYEAIAACEKAIELAPDFELARNNLNWAIQQSRTEQ